jgi:hypothetical protein
MHVNTCMLKGMKASAPFLIDQDKTLKQALEPKQIGNAFAFLLQE